MRTWTIKMDSIVATQPDLFVGLGEVERIEEA
jgi:hypothetical protein